jgi:hypothetical protein
MKWWLFVAVLVLSTVPARGQDNEENWVEGKGMSCDAACAAVGAPPVISGIYTNGESFFICAANHGGAGFRAGYNLRPSWADACIVGYGGQEVFSRPYFCLCASSSTPPQQGGTIHVTDATYGLNCAVKQGDVTDHIARQCNGQTRCDYSVDHTVIGDPAYGCQKDYQVNYQCGGGTTKKGYAGPEAGYKSVVTLSCP